MHTQEIHLLVRDGMLLQNGRLEIRIVAAAELDVIAKYFKGVATLAYATERSHRRLPCYPYATQCEIIDFDQLEDGTLSVVLEGTQRLKVLSAGKTRQGYWMARATEHPNWEHEPIEGEFEIISAALEQFYAVNPNLYQLYNDVHLEDATWVSQRWLEVLPMYNRDKLLLAQQPDCHKTMDFVLHLLKSHVK